MVPAIILAAGRSERMGRPKALLPCGPGGPTFVARLAEVCREAGLADAIVVGRPGAEELRVEVERLEGRARFVENADADAGQLSSLLAGLNVADRPGTRAVLVVPVDTPLVAPSTIGALLAAIAAAPAVPIARAVHRGQHGHPVVFMRRVFDELRRADRSIGAKAVLRAHEGEILNVEVDDPGVLADLDTPEDYARIFGSAP